jgi:thiol-disulfide isomerase/thioredoxin
MKLRRSMLRDGVTAGLVVLIAALACAIAGGLLWQRGNGRMRAVGAARPGAPQAAGPVFVDSGSDPAAWPAASAPTAPRLTAGQLGHELGEQATLVQFSSAFCAPCRATRRILTDVAGMTDGVAYVEIDAESRLDLVRSLGVLRTPTVLVTDGDGTIVMRGSGQPRKPDVIAALGRAVDAGTQVSPIAGRE